MSAARLDQPWLEFELGAPMQVLSWAINRPGLVTARQILWREVRNSDLPQDLDVHHWLQGALAARGALDAVVFLTSRHIRHHHVAEIAIGRVCATAVATVGLSTGITAQLPPAGQTVLMVLMLLGRVGPATVAGSLALTPRTRHFEYPKERPLIG